MEERNESCGVEWERDDHECHIAYHVVRVSAVRYVEVPVRVHSVSEWVVPERNEPRELNENLMI